MLHAAHHLRHLLLVTAQNALVDLDLSMDVLAGFRNTVAVVKVLQRCSRPMAINRPTTIVAIWMKKSRQLFGGVVRWVDVEHGCASGRNCGLNWRSGTD
jgi:hypothetical protein